MTQSIEHDHNPRARLQPLKTQRLLWSTLKVVKAKVKNQLIPNSGFWYQIPDIREAYRFGIVPGAATNEMTWGDVAVVLDTLIEYFYDERHHIDVYAESSFYIDDEERGGLGSGAIRQAARQITDGGPGEDAVETATAWYMQLSTDCRTMDLQWLDQDCQGYLYQLYKLGLIRIVRNHFQMCRQIARHGICSIDYT